MLWTVTGVSDDFFLLAPKASEASKGAFYLFPGVVSDYCDACEREVTVEGGYCCWIGGREITVRVIIECAIGGLQKSGKSIRSGDAFLS